MKKLILAKDNSGVNVEKVNAFCDFCGEQVECIRSNRELEVVRIKLERVIVGSTKIVVPMFGEPYYKIRYRDYDYKKVINGTDKKRDFDVCGPCAKQIVALLK